MTFFAILFAPVLAASAALACSPPMGEARPLRYGEQCSFSKVHAISGETVGSPVLELASGTFSQIVTSWLDEQLVVTDCNASEYVQVSNYGNVIDWIDLTFNVGSCGPALGLDYVLPPTGKLQLDGNTTLADVVSFAEQEGYYLRTMEEVAIGEFDPFCGCKLKYPDSAGAAISREFDQTVRN